MTVVELRRLHLPLTAPFHTAHGVVEARDVLLVRVGQGWAECVAPSEPTYTAEYTAGAHAVLRDHLIPRWLRSSDLDGVRGHPMAKAALRMAALDDRLRRSHSSLPEHLGVTLDKVPAGITVGIPDTVDQLLAQVADAVKQGYRRAKLKIQPGWDVEPVRAVRAAFGDLDLAVDANGAYTDADALTALDAFGLTMIEQPLPPTDLPGLARAAQRLDTPVCLDESITTLADLDAALALHAIDALSIKPGRVGGIDQARQLHDRCVEQGLPACVGGMSETGLGRAVIVALAALPGFTLAGDLSASDRWYRQDIVVEPFQLVDGCLPVRGRVELAMDVVEDRTTSVEVFGRA